MSRSKRKPYSCPNMNQRFERKLHNHLLRRSGRKYLQLIKENPAREDVPNLGTLKREGLDERCFKRGIWWAVLDSNPNCKIELSRK